MNMRAIGLAAAFLAPVWILGCSPPEKLKTPKANAQPSEVSNRETASKASESQADPSPSEDPGLATRAARPAQEVAYDIVQKSFGPNEWQKFIVQIKDSYETWLRDNSYGSLKIFLDDRLLQIAPSVPDGQIPVLKKFMKHLALYKEFSEPPPKYIRDIKEKHKQDLENLLADFSWEKASDLVTKKSKEYTPEERKRIKESMEKHE